MLAVKSFLTYCYFKGWSSWNAFHRNFHEQNFYDAADIMAANGMQAAGYQYINVDGGWWNSTKSSNGHNKIYRNSSGFPSWDPVKYPHGLPALIGYIHNKGFKYGHYTDAGTAACDHEGGMSEGYERQDASLFASWKIE